MSQFLFCLLILLQPLHTSWEMTYESCFKPMKPSTYMKADVLLGGFVPLYYREQEENRKLKPFKYKPSSHSGPELWFWKNYQYVLAFHFASEEINKDLQLLPNVTLGFHLYSAFHSHQSTMEGALLWLSGGSKLIPNYKCQTQGISAAVIAGTTSSFSTEIGTLLELYKFPHVTYGPFDAMLSDKTHFPSLYQVAPKDSSLIQGMISLLLQFGWTWVAIFVSDDMKGENFLSDLRAQMVRKGICLSFTEHLPASRELAAIADIMDITMRRESNAHVFILYCSIEHMMILMMRQMFFHPHMKVWLVGNPHSTEWESIFKIVFSTFYSFHGTLSFSPQKKEIPGFKHFLKSVRPSQYPKDLYFHKFWVDNLRCSLPGLQCGNLKVCSPNSSLDLISVTPDMMSMSEYSYYVYNAVYAVARAFHKMLLEETEMTSPQDKDQLRLLPWQLHPFLRHVQFSDLNSGNESNYVENYDIYNMVMQYDTVFYQLVKVGEFIYKSPQEQGLMVKEEMIQWPRAFKQTPVSVCTPSCAPGFRRIGQEGRPVCCFSCVSCTERHISNQTDMEECIQCSAQEYPNRKRTHCLPKAVTFLALEDPLGMALATTALGFSVITVVTLRLFVKYRDTPIVKANNRTLSYILLISLLLCFLCALLFIGRPNTVTCILQQITFSFVFTVALSSVLAKTITVIVAFKVMKPDRAMRSFLESGASNALILFCSLTQLILCAVWLGTSPPFPDTDAHSDPHHIIILCNKGSVTAFYCVLGYLGALALGSFTVAFLARNLPDTFNEAKFLSFSMLVFCSVWITFLPVYHSTKGKAMVAVEVFSILASSAGLLGCIFAPKCYIILMTPEKNSLKGLKIRRQFGSNGHSLKIT